MTVWSPVVADVDKVFKALADPTRRSLLDEFFREDGQTLSALQERFAMTRFGVMKHLKQLEEAGLVVTRRRGREKLHFLNPVPIRLVHDRWVSKYAEPWAAALSGLENRLESPMEKAFSRSTSARPRVARRAKWRRDDTIREHGSAGSPQTFSDGAHRRQAPPLRSGPGGRPAAALDPGSAP